VLLSTMLISSYRIAVFALEASERESVGKLRTGTTVACGERKITRPCSQIVNPPLGG